MRRSSPVAGTPTNIPSSPTMRSSFRRVASETGTIGSRSTSSARPEHMEYGFDWSRARFPEMRLHQAEELTVDAARVHPVVLKRSSNHPRHLPGNDVGRNRDETCSSERNYRQRQSVISGKDLEASWRGGQKLGNLNEISAGLFDSDDVSDLRETKHSCRLKVCSCSRRNVVEQHEGDQWLRLPLGSADTDPLVRAGCSRDSLKGFRSIHAPGQVFSHAPQLHALHCGCSRQIQGLAPTKQQRLLRQRAATRLRSALRPHQ